MRALLVPLLAAGMSCLICAQGPSGNYQGASWRINEHHTLIWNAQPYLPVGAVVDGNPADIERAVAAGLRDFVVNLPANGAGWGDAFEALNKSGSRFLVRINSLAPMAQGVAVEPQGYRVSGLTTATKVSFDIPGATSALAIVVSRRDSAVVRHERVPIRDGKFSYDVPEINGLEHVLLVYPQMVSLEQPDFWDRLDSHRDSLLGSLRRSAPGAGFRGVVNPFGRLIKVPGREGRFVPTNQAFRDDLRIHLEIKYRSIETATRAWVVLASDIESFENLSRLVPLWSGSRGVAKLWDPATDRLYDTDQRRSAIWKDITETTLYAATKRFKRLTAGIRSITDVPVVQEWAGWAAPYHGGTVTLDGLGIRSEGLRSSDVVDAASRPTAAILRWKRPGWLLATEMSVNAGAEAGDFPRALETMADIGARGWFFQAASPESLQPVASLARSFSDTSLADTSPSPLFFPENAANPAYAQRLPGGRWWLPLPAAGDRLDLGPQFGAYRLSDGDQRFLAIWSRTGPKRTLLHMIDPKSATFETLDGSDPKPKVVKGGVEVSLTDLPLIMRGTDEVPAPKEALDDTIAAFETLLTSGPVPASADENSFHFMEARSGFERNPGGALMAMRAQYNAVRQRAARFAWLEAEASRETNFGEIAPDPSCSGLAALVLDTRVPPPSAGYYADYLVPVRSTEDQQVWIAARLPAAYRSSVSVLIGGQALAIEEEPIGRYGDGFAWYRLGTTRLAGAQTTLRLRVDSPSGADIAVDAILITPSSFRPNGVAMPEIPVAPRGKD